MFRMPSPLMQFSLKHIFDTVTISLNHKVTGPVPDLIFSKYIQYTIWLALSVTCVFCIFVLLILRIATNIKKPAQVFMIIALLCCNGLGITLLFSDFDSSLKSVTTFIIGKIMVYAIGIAIFFSKMTETPNANDKVKDNIGTSAVRALPIFVHPTPANIDEIVAGNGYCVYLLDLPIRCTVEEVHNIVTRFGPVVPGSISVHRRDDGFYYGYLRFVHCQSMVDAIQASPVHFQSPIRFQRREVYICAKNQEEWFL